MIGRASYYLVFSTLFCVLFSCSDISNKLDYLPSSSGDIAELIVVYHKQGTTEEFKDSVKSVFSSPVNGLPNPSEPQFKVIFTDETYFRGYFREHHHLYIFLTKENLEVLDATYGTNNKDKILEIIANEKVLGFNKEDVWAVNQNVTYVTATNHRKLLDKLYERKAELLAGAEQNELATGAGKMLTVPIEKDSFYLSSMDLNGYAIRKPHSYRLAINNKSFYWLRKETSKYDYGIMIYSYPNLNENDFSLDSIISRRNSFTKKYIPGEVKNSYMAVSEEFRPYSEEINFKGNYAISVKGWWTVVGDYMGGPFVLYAVYDKENARIITAEGFIYGPNKNKVKPLRELEIILNSLTLK